MVSIPDMVPARNRSERLSLAHHFAKKIRYHHHHHHHHHHHISVSDDFLVGSEGYTSYRITTFQYFELIWISFIIIIPKMICWKEYLIQVHLLLPHFLGASAAATKFFRCICYSYHIFQVHLLLLPHFQVHLLLLPHFFRCICWCYHIFQVHLLVLPHFLGASAAATTFFRCICCC